MVIFFILKNILIKIRNLIVDFFFRNKIKNISNYNYNIIFINLQLTIKK